ncbi:trimeric intracellular cation channel family protein [Qipengyuania sp. YIM B01966]|uniref:trimeric intracellular cation channel family protein n=1 Tax=Qipengyuania sp. YIM B01966 TaxID=2778646 RepID=UPI0018F2A1A8|nr:trimeric intracellular cation channel family protein [Qipengyuania sp. YIM B01966]
MVLEPPDTLLHALAWLDLGGVALFALTGAVVAARAGQTFVTLAFLALATGVGGGSVRDVLIGAPVFWIRDPWVAAVCLLAALVAWFTPTRWWEGKLVDLADGLGMTGFAVFGTSKALSYGVTPVPAIIMGVFTGCVGGIIRDVLIGRPSILLRPEIYVTAAALSASLCVLGELASLPTALVWTIAVGCGFALRAAAIMRNIGLPAYRDRG